MTNEPMTTFGGRAVRAEHINVSARSASAIRHPPSVIGHWRAPRRGLAAALGYALIVVMAGCGYRPLGTEALPAHVRSVAIGPIANSTFRSGLQGFLSEYLHQRFQGDGRVRLRPSTDADAIIETIITSYGAEGVAWDQDGVARRFRVQVSVGITLRDRRNHRALISEGIAGEAYYTAGTGVGSTLAAEEDGTRRALRDLADRVATRIIEGL